MSTPLLPTPQDNQDVLSDYLPQSNEISRVPSAAPSVAPEPAPSASKHTADDDDEEEEEEEEDEIESDRDAKMKPQGSKASQKKQAKDKLNATLASRRSTQASLKSADSIKRFTYLLGQTDLFKHFCDLKAQRDPDFAALLEEAQNAGKKGRGRKGKAAAAGARGRKSEKEEDNELLQQEGGEAGEGEGEGPFVFTESPAYVKGGKMREYQVQGLNWMCGLHYNGINGILADEMGLGKTLQTISFLGYLKFIRNIPGPHLIVVPKSTLDNWAREVDRWVPGFSVVVLKGTKEERAELIQQRILPGDFNILLASYEIVLREKTHLRKLPWEYIVIDEAHRIKNVDSMLSQIVRLFDSRGRLLITGTPLQNNLHELWALLNFLLPDVFSDVADFDAWFERQAPKTETAEGEAAAEAIEPSTEDPVAAKAAEADASNAVVKQLHAVLRPFLLRRVKMDVEKSLLPKKEINVYVGMTDLQRKWYKSILEKDIDAVNGLASKKEGKTRLQNIVMQLRKCCNHPYLFDGAEPGPPFTTDEHLVEAAGKMVVLDKLLKSMKAKGSRVLIFSQMSRVLDILEDYCLFREYQYCRLDGGTAHEDRMEQIDAFNQPGSEKFIFLLTTRAGGLGINLVTADIVVLYDSDWNPQADLQAMDRAHRIGQTKQVYVFRFVTENAVEEKVLERAAQKLRLDQLVIQQGRAQQQSKAAGKEDLVEMIQHGADKIINSAESMSVTDDIDEIISRGESKTAELNSKYASLSFDELQIFNQPNAQGTTTQWEGEEYGGRKKLGQVGGQGMLWIEPSKRERKAATYGVDAYYRGALGNGRPGRRGPRGPRRAAVDDFKFFPEAVQNFQEKELLYFRKQKGEKATLRVDENASAEELEAERQEEQDAIDNAEPLTEEEKAEKEELMQLGFVDWTKREFQAFVRGMEMYGRDDYEAIHRELPSKTVQEIKTYAETFWERYTELEESERIIEKLEAAENKRKKDDRVANLIKRKVAETAYPLQQMKIIYANQTKGKSFSEDEDRFLLVELAKYGGLNKEDAYERIKRDINEWPAFRFDWFMKSRTVTEIKRRCDTLTGLVAKEYNDGTEEELIKPRGRGRKSAAAAAEGAEGEAGAAAKKPKGGAKRKAPGAAAVGGTGDDAASNASASRASTPAAGPAPKKAKK
ncbi:hypothetical protein JCM8097_006631 [Rhodosporidiobolus ruineniae]